MSKCDIIIPVWNQLEDTKDCIDSILRNTKYPYRIIIDNASDQETASYLDSLAKEGIFLIRNKQNEGFIKAVNNGIRASNAEFVCILNNDTIVTNGWIGEMIKVLEKNASIGLVNPSSNTLGQNTKEGLTLDMHAKEIKHQTGQFVELGNAFGFCMLVRRKLFDKIGLFDEGYGMGYFEDTDLSLRAKQKGYKAVRAFSSYVYHKESVSFKLLKSFNKDFKENKRIFEQKWGKTKRIMVVLKDVNLRTLDYLKDIIKRHARERSWVYVISPFFETKEFFERNSNITFYPIKKFFYLRAFLKILFKKKKINTIFCKKGLFFKVLKILHGSKIENVQ